MTKTNRAGLTLEYIVETAVCMRGKSGSDPSLRAVARELGVTPMALYRHVADKDALMKAVQRSLAAAMPTEASRGRADLSLSETEVVEGALELVAECGLHSLSMRALGRRLHVSPMALYRYVPNKAALLTKMSDAVIRRATRPQPTAENWRTLFRAHAHEMWTLFSAYPGLVGSFPTGPSATVLENMNYAHSILLASSADAHAAAVAATSYQTFMLGLYRTQAYLHLLMSRGSDRHGVRGDQVRRFGDRITLREQIDCIIDSVIAGLEQSR